MNQVSDNIAKLQNILQGDKVGGDFFRPEFHHILDEMALSLDQQNSDGALNSLVLGAIELHASDIHLEIQETTSTIRFRIDGDLATLGEISLREHVMIVERMKYRSNLKLNIHTVPQDGKFRLGKDDTTAKIDIRVSVMPTRYGESVVCRVLDAAQTVKTLDTLGIIGPAEKLIKAALQKKQGMILVTGPTGSGKTTTLYTIMDTLRKPEDKIITLEDPIEYQIPGILQSEINEREGYSFAMGVRSVLRHDPDIIMIGEIRDLDTANTAVQAALTGHLVLSTLHTKSAIETLDRLINMGVSSYDIAASVDLIISQRLVRRNCPHCSLRDDIQSSPEILALIEKYGAHSTAPQHGAGCELCANTGYRGRMGIYEVLRMTDAVREAIHGGKADADIQTIMDADGYISITDDARAKVALGMTTLEECQRNGIL